MNFARKNISFSNHGVTIDLEDTAWLGDPNIGFAVISLTFDQAIPEPGTLAIFASEVWRESVAKATVEARDAAGGMKISRRDQSEQPL